MAPALIEAAATVSQSSVKKFDFLSTTLLEDLASNFARRRGISTTATERTLETSSGRFTKQVANTAIKNQLIKSNVIKSNFNDIGGMNVATEKDQTHISFPERSQRENESFDQSSDDKKQSTLETCALSDTEGGKSVDVRCQPLVDSAPYMKLKERTKRTDVKLQALERRAKNLKQRVRNFQTGRLLSHVKTQAQLLDYSNKASHDPRTKTDPNLNDSFQLNQDRGKNLLLKNKNLETCNNSTPTASSPSLTSLLKSEPQTLRDLGHQGENPSLGSNKNIAENENQLKEITARNKKDVFGVLTNSVKDIINLDDPDATDPESDEDDTADTPLSLAPGEARRFSKVQYKTKSFDPIWAKDRVKIGSMCTWIQAQIADLSHKIKRYGDLHHHIKTNRKQFALEEAKKQVISGNELQHHLEESLLGKDDLNGDSLQSNIFARLQAHKNGLAKELSGPTETEIVYEKGSGARTIPVAKIPKHKYVKRSIETAFKGNSVSYQCSNLPAPFPCAQCLKATTTGFGKTTENIPAVHLDHSYHQQLSTKYDCSLPLLLQSSLTKDRICVDKKNLLLAASVKSSLADTKDSTSRVTKENATSTASKASRLRLDKKRNRRISKQVDDDSDKEDSPVPKKKVAPPTAASLLQRRANSLRAPSSGSGESRPATPITDQSLLSASCPTPTLSQMVKKKSRTSSEYDINNIVIPYSIASSTRLEKPQYKEILTPGWRVIDCEPDGMTRKEIEQLEDTSDSAYTQRHSRYEVSEHHKFTAFFQLPLKRSRSSRKSSECNTPEPYSPSHPDTPGSAHTPSEFILATPSSAKINKVPAWTLQSNLDENRVMPWPCRTFPLEGEDEVHLDEETLSAYSTRAASRSTSFTAEEVGDIGPCEERAVEKELMPSSNSSDSELVSPTPDQPQEEDDEKWTVRLMSEVKSSPADQGTVRKGIVLKLAKK